MSETKTPSTSSMVTGLFPDRPSAEAAYQTVAERGYSRDDVSLVMSDQARARHFAGDAGHDTELGTKAAEGAGIGGAIGGTLGAVAAAIAAIGTSLVLPGIGLVVAGPLAAALAGAGAGGAAGGLLGALIGYGIPEERVKHYDEGIRSGGILLGVVPRSDDDARHFETKWKEQNGEHVIGTGAGSSAGAGTDTAIGASVGGSAMHLGTKAVNLAAEEAYWHESYLREPYVNKSYSYADYAPAYALGYTSRAPGERTFDSEETQLANEWSTMKGASRLSWDEARSACRAAWDRIR